MAYEVWAPTTKYQLHGVTRANVLRLCRANGIVARELDFSLTSVYSAAEAFVTGTFAGLIPVTAVRMPCINIKFASRSICLQQPESVASVFSLSALPSCIMLVHPLWLPFAFDSLKQGRLYIPYHLYIPSSYSTHVLPILCDCLLSSLRIPFMFLEDSSLRARTRTRTKLRPRLS